MLKPERMSKLFVLGPKSKLEKVVSKLQELKVAHIIEHKKDEFDLCAPLKSFDKVSSLLVQIRSIMSHLNISSANPKPIEFNFNKLEKNINEIREEVNKVIDETKNTEDEISLLSNQKEALKQMALLNLSPEYFQKSNYIKSYFGYINDPNIKEKLENITDRFEIKAVQHNKRTLAALFVDSKLSDQFDKILADASFSDIDISIANELKGAPNELIEKISKKQEKLETNLKIQNNKLKKLSDKHFRHLIDAERFLSVEAEKAQAPLSFGSTRETFFMRCYLPEADMEKVKNEIAKVAGNKLHIVEEPLGEEEEIPVKLNNPRYIKEFEFFTNLYNLPKYNEFDPTFLMAFTFPLFFGFMLGDVGYGLVTFALFYWLKKKFQVGKNFFNILMAASVSAILFGFIYGEVFGYEPWHGLIIRTHSANTLMLISIIAGVVQVNFGLILGFISEYKHHGFLKAAYEKLSWILLQISAVALYASYANIINLPVFAGYTLLALSIFMLYKGEGYMGLMEIPTILTHIVSYARLMAVGLASVFIAVMVNDFATFLFHKGILFIPLALIALIIGHLFNIALGILSPSLHSIRLHYVEFFTKFYKGGGIEYLPFGAEKQKSIL
tara:strand:- start:888 stop:2726 length:1839 start_codon:yes stop_codon:yes gene_type:complete